MQRVRDILAGDYRLVEIEGDRTVVAAAKRMGAAGVGSLVVTKDSRPVGIVTEADLVRRVLGIGRDPALTPVAEVMSAPLTTVGLDTEIQTCRRIMTRKKIRHLPVRGPNRPIAMISARDVLKAEAQLQRQAVAELKHYLYDYR